MKKFRILASASPLIWAGLAFLAILRPGLFTGVGELPRAVISFVIIFFLPGYFCLRLVWPAHDGLGWVEFPIAFAFSLGLFVFPAVLLCLLHAPWVWFTFIYLLVLMVGSGLYVYRTARSRPLLEITGPGFSLEPFLIVALLAGVAILTSFAVRNDDDWIYLGIVQQRVHQTTLSPIYTVQARDALRYTLQDWVFLEAFAVRELDVDPIYLVRSFLPVVLVPLSFLACYGLAHTLLPGRRSGVMALCFQLLICLTDWGTTGWGRNVFARIGQDKMLTGFLLLPLAFFFFWRFQRDNRWPDLLGLFIVLTAIASVHPLGVAMLALAILFFGTLNVLFEWKNWRKRGWVLVAPFLILVAFILSARIAFPPYLYSLLDPSAATRLRLNEMRLVVTSPWLYTAHPELIDNPLILLAIGLIPLFAGELRRNRVAQFLFATGAGTLASTFAPLSSALVGQIVTPYEIWRITWLVPVALILSYFTSRLDLSRYRSILRKQEDRTLVLPRLLPFLILAVAAGILGTSNPAQAYQGLTGGHTLAPDVDGVMRALAARLDRPEFVLLPLNIRRLPTAFSANARVYSLFQASTASGLEDRISRFYGSSLFGQDAADFVRDTKAEWIVTRRTSPINDQLPYIPFLKASYCNAGYVLYQVVKAPGMTAVILGNTSLDGGSPRQALEHFDLARQLAPEDPLAYFGLGWSYQELGQVDAAIQAYETSIKLNPANRTAHLRLTRLYEKKGDKAKMKLHQQAMQAKAYSCPGDK